MTQQILITLNIAGVDTGPFNIQDNLGNLLGSNISKDDLLAGIIYDVDINATQIIISSLGDCENGILIDISGIATTTTTTTTIPVCLPAGTILSSFCAPGPYCQNGLDLWYTYADGACGSYSEPSGLCCSGSVNPGPTLDTIYFGVLNEVRYPIESEILSGSIINDIDAAQNITINWVPFNSSATCLFFVIPNRTINHNKNKWYEDFDNNGNIGGISDLFGPPSSIVVNGISCLSWHSNWLTQVYGEYLLQKI